MKNAYDIQAGEMNIFLCIVFNTHQFYHICQPPSWIFRFFLFPKLYSKVLLMMNKRQNNGNHLLKKLIF